MANYYTCEWCGNRFLNASNSTVIKYCSSACKQAAYRDSKRKKPRGYQPDTSPVEKAIETKTEQDRLFTCQQCGMGFEVNGLQHGSKYCSRACQQKAYRQRRQWRAESEKRWSEKSKQATKKPVDPMDALKQQLETAMYEMGDD